MRFSEEDNKALIDFLTGSSNFYAVPVVLNQKDNGILFISNNQDDIPLRELLSSNSENIRRLILLEKNNNE